MFIGGANDVTLEVALPPSTNDLQSFQSCVWCLLHAGRIWLPEHTFSHLIQAESFSH